MRIFMAFVLAAGALALMPEQSVAQRNQPSGNATPVWPYCQRQAMSGSLNCGFASFEQCMASVSGDGGDCIRNPALSGRR